LSWLALPLLALCAGCSLPDPMQSPLPPTHTVEVVSSTAPYALRVETNYPKSRAPASATRSDAETLLFIRNGRPLNDMVLPSFYVVQSTRVPASRATTVDVSSRDTIVLTQGHYKN